jgi:hypothetical protein
MKIKNVRIRKRKGTGEEGKEKQERKMIREE